MNHDLICSSHVMVLSVCLLVCLSKDTRFHVITRRLALAIDQFAHGELCLLLANLCCLPSDSYWQIYAAYQFAKWLIDFFSHVMSFVIRSSAMFLVSMESSLKMQKNCVYFMLISLKHFELFKF